MGREPSAPDRFSRGTSAPFLTSMGNPPTASQVLVDADTPCPSARGRASRLTTRDLPPDTTNFPKPFPSALHGNSARNIPCSLGFQEGANR